MRTWPSMGLLLLATLLIKVSLGEDLYWEGEEDASNEFLEVKEDSSAISNFKRFKRDWWNPFSFGQPTTSTTTPAPENEAITEDPDDTIFDSKDDEERTEGSGSILEKNRNDADTAGEKTLRVTFVVVQPYQVEYSNRDSRQFQQFSKTLAQAVNLLFDSLPGTQKASLIRIQSRLADNFSCKVTLDIVTAGYDNTDHITKTLHDYIKNYRFLGGVAVKDEDFSANVVNPGSAFETCRSNEIQCDDGSCISETARCNGITECHDGSDEQGCPLDAGFDINQQANTVESGPNAKASCADPIPCASSSVTICIEQRCDGFPDCPSGDDEDPNLCSQSPRQGPERGDQPLYTTPAVVDVYQPETTPYISSDNACPDGEFLCDENRCIANSKVCNQVPDCYDNTDEQNCPKSCGVEDFRCRNGKCIESLRRCDRVSDCPNGEDEDGCPCGPAEFQCINDGACIEARKYCDGVPNCKDGTDELDCRHRVCKDAGRFRCGDGTCISILLRCDGYKDCRNDGNDEADCPCSSDKFQCDRGFCIEKIKRCDGRVDCPSDRSDERNCYAKGLFKCSSGKIIPDSLRCNRHYDCPNGDYSDEQNCPCGDQDFKCKNGHCISKSKRCDRTHDCQDGSDELLCTYGKECMAYEFKCTSGQCVHAESRCNGTAECFDESDEKLCPCKRGQFRCRDGSCINIALRCNGQKECRRGEDEVNCGEVRCPPGSFTCDSGSSVQCATRCDNNAECENSEDEDNCQDCQHECDGRCLEDRQICDGRRDCSDGSDEEICDNCDGPDDFRCTNGECIKASLRCNNATECSDESDELNCSETMIPTNEGCLDSQFRCRDGTCINQEFLCDGTADCYDRSDEESCPSYKTRTSRSPPATPCRETEFKCYDGPCIPYVRRCDNFYDCSDFSDEQNCHAACESDEFQCLSRECIPLSYKCNGESDCSDGSDEQDCSPIGPGYTTEYQYPAISTASPYYTTTRRTDDEYSPGRSPYGSDNGQSGYPNRYSPYAPGGTDSQPENRLPSYGAATERQPDSTVRPTGGDQTDRNAPSGSGTDRDIYSGTTSRPDARYDPYGNGVYGPGPDPYRPTEAPGSPDYGNRPSDPNGGGYPYNPYGNSTPEPAGPSEPNRDPYAGGRYPGAPGGGSGQGGQPGYPGSSGDPYGGGSYPNVPGGGSEQPRYPSPNGDQYGGGRYPSAPGGGSGQEGQPGYPRSDGDQYGGGSYPNAPGGGSGQGGQPGYPRSDGDQYGGGSYPNAPGGGSGQEGQPGYPRSDGDQYGGGSYPNTPGGGSGQGGQPGYPRSDGDQYGGGRYPSAPGGGSGQGGQPEYPSSGGDQYGGGSYPNAPGGGSGQGGQPSYPRSDGDQYGGGSAPGGGSGQAGQPEYPSSGGDQYGGGRYPNAPGGGSGQGGQPGYPRSDGDQYGGGSYPNAPGGGSGQGGQPGYPRSDGDQYGGGSYPSAPGGGSGQGGQPEYPGSGGEQYGGGNYPYGPSGGSGQGGQPSYPGSGGDQNGGGSYPDASGGGTGQSGYPGSDGGRLWSGSQSGGSVRGGSVACQQYEWRCENGPCIDSRRRCDGRVDCPYDFSDELDCPPGSPVTLDVKTYPDEQSVRFGTASVGGDVVFQCRDEGPIRAPVRWVREGGKSLKPGSIDRNGRLELFQVTGADSGVYICQTPRFLGKPGSEVRVTLNVDHERAPKSKNVWVSRCGPYEATCGNGDCIPKSAVCNGKFDCSDKSDEDMCTMTGFCEPNQFQCENRKCVLKTWICDSEDDCGDNSDEELCDPPAPNQLCLNSEFACHNITQCVPKSFHCDGRGDCLDRSDELGCAPVYIVQPPSPNNIRLEVGDTLVLRAEATGSPVPFISWRLNWGHVPPQCKSTSIKGIGILTCPNMRPEHSGAYSAEALNNKGTTFANPDSVVYVNSRSPCNRGYFNKDARSEAECIRCFCFGESMECKSADLFTYNMPTPLGEGGTRLRGFSVTRNGELRTDSTITEHYYYQPLRNGATITKLDSNIVEPMGDFYPYLSLPETYNGQQLTSYGGHIKFDLVPHSRGYEFDTASPTIIIKGKYTSLFYFHRSRDSKVDIRLTPENWLKTGIDGFHPSTREDIMMALDQIDTILIRANYHEGGVNISNFVMESAQHIDIGLGSANLVEECTCPPGYEGLSCQKCSNGYVRESGGPWLGNCVRESCPPGTYGDPSTGASCKPCPCPLTTHENRFARTCSLGSNGSITCDCFPGYEGKNCEVCAQGYEGNPLVPGDKCSLKPTEQCNPLGTDTTRLLDECVCKDNVQGRYCDHCKNNSFFLSKDFRYGCALCFCSGVSQQCMSSNLRRKTTSINFKVPNIVEQVKVYNIAPKEAGATNYPTPAETQLKPVLTSGGLTIGGLDNQGKNKSQTFYYWSLPTSLAGNKVTSYGGYLRYTLDNVPSYSMLSRNNVAADVQLVSDNHLTFQYTGDFKPTPEGLLNATVQFLEDGWERSDGKEVSREHFLLALADVKAILIKATYGDTVATPLYASIDTAEPDANGQAALHVEQCVCPKGYIGTSCEDCALGYTRSSSGLYLAHCDVCECSGRSTECHPETGVCFGCAGNTEGAHCELCKYGYERDYYDNCVEVEPVSTTSPCSCDPRGSLGSCDDNGQCTCKPNVEGPNCDSCRPGTFGLDENNPYGCINCFCFGATQECLAANHFTRIAMAAPVIGDDYGGYVLTDLNAENIINDGFVPVPDKSELIYVFSNSNGADLFWSLPVFPGNRVTSYGGTLAYRQAFKNVENSTSVPGNDVVLASDFLSLYWTNPSTLYSGRPMTMYVPLSEYRWYRLGTHIPASRMDFMRVLKNLRRVLVRATIAKDLISTSIADVSMDTAVKTEDPYAPPAVGVEVCACPPGHLGTSCESCVAGYYKNEQDYCTQCPCSGHDCHLNSYREVTCNCRPPYTGPDCSEIGLIMELHPEIREDIDDSIKRSIILTCKYKAPEPLIMKFVISGIDQRPFKPANESKLLRDGWHGQHVLRTVWDTRDTGVVYECHTLTARGTTLGVLATDMRDISGTEYSLEVRNPEPTSNRPPSPQTTVTVRITSPTIRIQEVGSSVNFTCQAQSRVNTNRLPVTWNKINGHLPQDRVYVDQYSGLLKITNLQITDSGVYICQTNDGMSTGQATVTLRVPANKMTIPTVSIKPTVTEYHEGDRIVLECSAQGNPTPSIYWQRSSRQLLPINSQQNGAQFIIDGATEEDSGEYSCIATNTAGTSESIAVIYVQPLLPITPNQKLTVTPLTPVVDEGQSTRVVCTGSANVPAGTIDWIRQDNERFQGNVRSDNGVLYIDVATLENQGVYICQTQNANVPPVAILVTVNPVVTPAPVDTSNISVPFENIKIPAGESGSIECTPSGTPLPRVDWTKHQGSFGPGVSQRGDILMFNNAQESDAGYYVCKGMIEGQSRPVGLIYVNVEIEKREAPRLQIWPEGEQPAMLGSTFEFHCRVLAGNPEPMVTWDRANGRALTQTTHLRQNNILSFENVDVNDEGEYICSATNIAGRGSASGVLKVRQAPDITLTPNNYMTVNYGEPLRMECRANGYPQPMITIRGPDRREIAPPSLGIATIRVTAATERDDGDYTCTASSAAGTVEEPFVVRVYRGDFDGSGESEFNTNNPNYNSDRPSDFMVTAGQRRTEIDCYVEKSFGTRWDRSDRQPLQSNVVQEGNKLVIYNATKADSGEYVCSMYNSQTNSVQRARFIRLLVVSPPKITLHPPTQIVSPGQSPTVECYVDGDDIQYIKWSPYNRGPSRRVEIRNSTLIFHQIEVEDAGKYQCFARNRFANASATAEVIVAEETEVETSESHENEQWVRVGAAVVLSCNMTAPGVTVRWSKDGRSVPRSVRVKQDGSLYIKLATKADSGIYVCHIHDTRGRVSSNYINLHIEGVECLDTEFRCYDDSGCLDKDLLCDGFEDCKDRSDEEDCLLRDKRYSEAYRSARPEPGDDSAKLVKIDQQRQRYISGDNVEVSCRALSRDVDITWEKYGTKQFVETRQFGGGAMLIVHGVTEADAGVYRCVGVGVYGQTTYEDFELDVEPGSSNPSYPPERKTPVVRYTAHLHDSVSMPCNHNLDGPVNIIWKRVYAPLPSDVRSDQPSLHLNEVNEGDAGTYICRVSNNRASVESRAILRVVGVVPSFNGDSWIALPTIKDAYRQFDIEVSFKPTDANGLILYNSHFDSHNVGDYLALQLEDGVPQFVLETGNGPVYVKGDRPLQLNVWHTIRLSRIGSQVTMDVDNIGPFANHTAEDWVLELREPLYIGGVPDLDSLPPQLAGASGFVGCVSMLILGREEKNIIVDGIDRSNVEECDTCSPNLCLNDGVCQEARNERGFVCICGNGFAGQNCDRRGEACHPGLCGPGKCQDTADGYKCACPVTHTGRNCEETQSVEYPAFTGSAYLALDAPDSFRFFKMSMKVKPTHPVQDGIIMYCAESKRGLGGFTSLAVRNQKLEFRYDLNEGNPMVLVSNTTLPAREWTDVQITRSGPVFSLTINLIHTYEQRRDTANKSLNIKTPMFVGGVDETITLNNNTGVTGGFNGCIKDVMTQGNSVNIVTTHNYSGNVQDCNMIDQHRGDIPELENPCSCKNGGTCNPDGTCSCPPGTGGYYCENRTPSRQTARRPPANPCAERPCRNGGTCRIDYSNAMNHSCECTLGYAGASCQMELYLYQSVSFNGNGYLELPMTLLDYENEADPATIALAVFTTQNGVLLYQAELSSPRNDFGTGDFVLLRIERGHVVLDWDMGSGVTSLTIDSKFVADGERHQIIVRFLSDNKVELTVDDEMVSGYTTGLANRMGADSNIYIGGIPARLNYQQYPGLSGCIEQIEFMNNDRAVVLGDVAVAGRNTQRCRQSMFPDLYPFLEDDDGSFSPPPEYYNVNSHPGTSAFLALPFLILFKNILSFDDY